MAKLWIANCTLQTMVVNYRIDWRIPGQRAGWKPHKQQTLASGECRPIGGDLEMAQISEIITQLTPLGMVGTVDMNRLGKQRYPLLFSIDKPVPRPLIRQLYDHNCGMLAAQGKARRRNMAIAANDALMSQLGEDTKKPPEFVVDVEQEVQSELGENRIEEGFRVTNDAPGAAPPPSAGRSRGAAKGRSGGSRKAA